MDENLVEVKIHSLTGRALDWMVGTLEGEDGDAVRLFRDEGHYCYSSNGTQAVTIIEREGIETLCNRPAMPQHKDPAWQVADWFACRWNKRADHYHGPTPLIAAMRCYVASRCGEKVRIPADLLTEEEAETPRPRG